MTDVFISYSRKDKEFVQTLHEALKANNRETWVDWQDIPLTADWWQEIERGIEGANTFVFVISSDSICSKVCHQEIDHAVKHNKRLVPIVHRDDFEMSSVHAALSKHNWLFFREQDDFDRSFESLINAIDTDLEHVRTHTRLLERAIEWDTKNRNPSFLLRGDDLEDAEQWLAQGASKEPRPTELQGEYIGISRTTETVRQKIENRRQRLFTAGIGAFAMLAVGAAGFAFQKQYEAEGQRRVAIAKSEEANQQRDRAEQEQEKVKAEQQKTEDALKQAKAALIQAEAAKRAEAQQKVQAIEAQELAEQQKIEAQRQTKIAKEQKAQAVTAKKIADRRTVEARFAKKQAEIGRRNAELVAQSITTTKLFNSGSNVEALIQGVKTGQQLKKLGHDAKGDTRLRATLAVWQSVYGIHEVNRLEGHKDTVEEALFSPDGKTIITQGQTSDGTVKIWTLDGKEIRTIKDEEDKIVATALSQDGQMLATANLSKTIKIRNLQGKVIKTLTGYRGIINEIAFSPDGKFIALASQNFSDDSISNDENTVQIWDVNQAKEVFTLRGHRGGATSVSFSSDGQFIASGSHDGTIKLWQTNGKELQTIKTSDSSYVNNLNVKFSPNSRTIVSGGTDGVLQLWDLQGNKLKTIGEKDSTITSIDFSHDGKVIAAGYGDGLIKFWSAEGWGKLKEFKGHTGIVYRVTFSPDDQFLLGCGTDRTARLWQVNGQQPTALKTDKTEVFHVEFDSTGKFFATTNRFDGTSLWTVTGKLLWQQKTAFSDTPYDVAFSRDHQLIASANGNNVTVWNFAGQEVANFAGHTSKVYSVSFSPDGKTLASASVDSKIKLWDLNNKTLIKTLDDHSGMVMSVRFSPDGKKLLTGSWDTTVKLWGLDTQKVITLKGHRGPVYAVAFSPDGQMIASASADATVKLWNLAGEELHSLKGHGTTVASVSFSPDGTVIATSSYDGTIRFWNLLGEELVQYEMDDGSMVYNVVFNPSQPIIAASGRGGPVILWNIDPADLISRGCTWLQDYLKNSPSVPEGDRQICSNVKSSVVQSSVLLH